MNVRALLITAWPLIRPMALREVAGEVVTLAQTRGVDVTSAQATAIAEALVAYIEARILQAPVPA